MAEHLRALGFSSRAQTNADSEVLQIPLILLAGLGELSRIGELVLNPFVGPRFKSVVMTTDIPLVPGQADRFRFAVFLFELRQVRARMPVRCDYLGRQGDVQRL